MSNLIKIALLAAALFTTVACTEDPETALNESGADVDQPEIDSFDGEPDSINPRDLAPGAASPGGDVLSGEGVRTATAPTAPGTGLIECRTFLTPRAETQPVVGTASQQQGRNARLRYDRLRWAR